MKTSAHLQSICFLPLLVIATSQFMVASTSERIRMVGPSPADEAIKTLTSFLEAACNKRDVVGYLSLFVPRTAKQIRRSVEDLFVCNDVALEVHETLLLSVSEREIVFGVRYSWHDGDSPRQLIASRVTAKRIGESWLLDREIILSKRVERLESPGTAGPVANPVGGQVPCQGRPALIPADIEWVPGGCANGRCGL